MIVLKAGALPPAADRLLSAVSDAGHTLLPGPEALGAGTPTVAGDEPLTLVVSDGPAILNLLGVVRSLGPRRFRVLLLSRLGAHPDARADTLRRLWRLEEHVRGGGAPTLTLRLAPLVGPETPFWRKLRSRPDLPGGGRKLVNPVAERDAVETIVRALDGRGPWRDWYEVAGSETFSLAELRDLASRTTGGRNGEWEPSLEEIAEHRLAEHEPWASAFHLEPTLLAACASAVVA